MRTKPFFAAIVFLSMVCVSNASAQVDESPNPAAAPPNMLLLVHQEFRFGKEGERQKLEIAISRACDHLKVPNDWIDLESISGPPGSSFLDPFDLFEQVDTAFADWPRIYASIRSLSARRRNSGRSSPPSGPSSPCAATTSATAAVHRLFQSPLPARSRGALGSRHERDFVEAFRILSGAYEKIKADTPWVVYQVNVGMPSPAFLVFMPLRELKQTDDLLNWRKDLREAEGEDLGQPKAQIAREAYAAAESNLYAISPKTSHVSKDFADGDPGFWSPKPSFATAKPSPRKDADAKPKP